MFCAITVFKIETLTEYDTRAHAHFHQKNKKDKPQKFWFILSATAQARVQGSGILPASSVIMLYWNMTLKPYSTCHKSQMTKTLAKIHKDVQLIYWYWAKRKSRTLLSAHFQAEVKWGGAKLVLATPGLKTFLRILLLYYTKICFAFHHRPPPPCVGRRREGRAMLLRLWHFREIKVLILQFGPHASRGPDSWSSHNITHTWLTLERNVDS